MKRILLNISETARLLDIRESTLYSWVSQKRIPYVKIGRLTKFDIREIDKWIKERTTNVRDS